MKGYHDSIAGNRRLSTDEERELAGRIADGDPEARDHLVRANLGLVVILACHWVGRSVAREDLVAEGNLGLLRAAEGYDGRSGVRFSTYARFWINQAMRRAVQNQSRLIRMPSHTYKVIARWRRAQTDLAERLGRAPTEDEIAGSLGLSGARRRIAREVLHAAGFTRCGHEEGEEMPGYHASGVPSPDAELAQADEVASVVASLDLLDPLEAAILRLRYGIDAEGPMACEAIGRRFGWSGERVRRLERRAIEQLRNHACRAAGATAVSE